MIIEDSQYTYMAMPTDVFDQFRNALLQALVSLKRDEFQGDDAKIRRAEYIIANVLNDSTETVSIPDGQEQPLRWFFELEDQPPEEETSEES